LLVISFCNSSAPSQVLGTLITVTALKFGELVRIESTVIVVVTER
jgi:hypothetical protein